MHGGFHPSDLTDWSRRGSIPEGWIIDAKQGGGTYSTNEKGVLALNIANQTKRTRLSQKLKIAPEHCDARGREIHLKVSTPTPIELNACIEWIAILVEIPE